MRILFSISFIVVFSLSSIAQRGNRGWMRYRHEASIGYGFNSFLANVGANDKFGVNFMLQRSTLNASYRYYFKKHFAVRGSFTHAYSRKNDKDGLDPLDPGVFSTPIDYEMTLTELAAMVEYHIWDEASKGAKRGKVRRARGGMSKGLNIGISFFTGIGFDYMRPYAELWGSKMVLKPYTGTNGFSKAEDYKKAHLHIPVGTTIRIIATQNWRVGVEAGYRIGFRDYINNVSAVYYADENPNAQYSDFTDTKFTGDYVTLEKENGPIGSLSSQNGRKNYFFGTITLAYRIKGKKKRK